MTALRKLAASARMLDSGGAGLEPEDRAVYLDEQQQEGLIAGFVGELQQNQRASAYVLSAASLCVSIWIVMTVAPGQGMRMTFAISSLALTILAQWFLPRYGDALVLNDGPLNRFLIPLNVALGLCIALLANIGTRGNAGQHQSQLAWYFPLVLAVLSWASRWNHRTVDSSIRDLHGRRYKYKGA